MRVHICGGAFQSVRSTILRGEGLVVGTAGSADALFERVRFVRVPHVGEESLSPHAKDHFVGRTGGHDLVEREKRVSKNASVQNCTFICSCVASGAVGDQRERRKHIFGEWWIAPTGWK